jgi:F420-dependent oxidoreductase-like protein
MQIALMFEGQDGLNWTRWKALVTQAEALGFAGVYRSDHFTNAHPPEKDSLELWMSLSWLADHSQTLTFGPIVSPVSFRHPAMTVRMAAAVHELSNGRLVLGLGAGWQEREHAMFGFPLLDMNARFKRFEEGLEVVTRLLRGTSPTTFEGEYYQLRDAVLLPKPPKPLPILIGGNGERRTLPLVVRYADEWNGVFIPANRFQDLSRKLDVLLAHAGRDVKSVRRSLMHGVICARTEDEVAARLAARGQTRDALAATGMIIGTPDQIPAQLDVYRAAGVETLMLQWMEQDDVDGLKALAAAALR